ncbi:MAG: acyl-CoA reductase [Saprospiraceae bacterium]
MLTLRTRIDIMARLGELFQDRTSDRWQAIMHKAYVHNKWFTIENINVSFDAIANAFLERSKLENWLVDYDIPEERKEAKAVAIIMAGNIPMVGFHDLLCVFMAGHKAQLKVSDKDKILIPFVISLLEEIDPATAGYFEIVEKLEKFDAVIATGSDNSSRYFETYFSKYPNIIRKNRNSVAVLTGEETRDELVALGKDVFRYFGLGCRNVSKVYLPEGYNFEPLLEALHEYREIQHHDKYKNNFDYNYTLLILNQIVYKANGCIIMTEDKAIVSRIACLHYEFYNNNNTSTLEKELTDSLEKIQCIVGKEESLSLTTVKFGEAQEPGLKDYADGVDTMAFLAGI